MRWLSRRRPVFALTAALVAVVAWTASRAEPPVPTEPPPSIPEPPQNRMTGPAGIEGLDGAALVKHFECNRCHEGDRLERPTADKACVGCHAAIHAGTFEAPKDILAHWQSRIVDLLAAPSLTSIGQRLQRSWVRDFLVKPHDLRPGSTAMMPRLPIDPKTAEVIAAWLVPTEAPSPDDARWLAWPSRGRRTMERSGCMTCHAFTGAPALAISPVPVTLEPATLELGIMLAPDLAHVRERFQRPALIAWLVDPPAQKPGTPMPKLGLSTAEATDIAAYLLETPLTPAAPKPIPARLPILERRVPFREVSEKVFHRICWHCHSEPDLALGDGGPGNTGGFGFAGRGLNLRDYPSITAGSLDDAGQRRSIFRKVEAGPLAGTPKLLAHLLARQVEEAGQEVPGIRGMPLGLPAMSPEDIQLVESWIAQGRPE